MSDPGVRAPVLHRSSSRSRNRALIACAAFVAVALVVPSYFRNEMPHLVSASMVFGAVVALCAALLPMSADRIDRWMVALDALEGAARVRVAVWVGALSSLIVAGMTGALHRPMQLLWHDEFQFHLQSQMLSRFRLWMPVHPLSEFFDTFYVLMTPHYAAQSFPGAALLFVPTVWLHLPTWVMPVLIAGVACGLLWWILSTLVNATGATVAIVMLLCTWGFLRVGTMYLAQVPVLVMGLVAFAAMLRWRATQSFRSAIVIGMALGWAAITRPLDAVCYGLIVLVGVVSLPWRDSPWRAAPMRTARRVAMMGLFAMPFLALQGVFDEAMTGSFTKTPFAFYNERDQPALVFNGVADTTRLPKSTVPQKQAFYAFATMGFVNMYNDPRMRPSILWRIRLNETQAFLAPALILLPFAAVGLVGLATRQRWMLFALAPLFLVTYQRYPIYNAHYIVFALPAVLLLFALAPDVVRSLVPRVAAVGRRVMVMLLVGVSVGALADRAIATPPDDMQYDRQSVETALSSVTAPAIVLFTAPSRPEDTHTEFVYNDATAWPDDAPIIRAHDRDADNMTLYRYYAAIQPTRAVWRYDRRTQQLVSLGSVRALAAGGAGAGEAVTPGVLSRR